MAMPKSAKAKNKKTMNPKKATAHSKRFERLSRLNHKQRWSAIVIFGAAFVVVGTYLVVRSFAQGINGNTLVLEYATPTAAVGNANLSAPQSTLPFRLYQNGLAICGNTATDPAKSSPYYSTTLDQAQITDLVNQIKATGLTNVPKTPPGLPKEVQFVEGRTSTISLNTDGGLYQVDFINTGQQPRAEFTQARTIIENFCKTVTTPYQPKSVHVSTVVATNVDASALPADKPSVIDTPSNGDQTQQQLTGTAAISVASTFGNKQQRLYQQNGQAYLSSLQIDLPPVTQPRTVKNNSKKVGLKLPGQTADAATQYVVSVNLFCSTDSCNSPRVPLDYYRDTDRWFYQRMTGKVFLNNADVVVHGTHPASYYTTCHFTASTCALFMMPNPTCLNTDTCATAPATQPDPFLLAYANMATELSYPSNLKAQFVTGFTTGARVLCGHASIPNDPPGTVGNYSVVDFTDPLPGSPNGTCSDAKRTVPTNFDLGASAHELGHNLGLLHPDDPLSPDHTPVGIMNYPSLQSCFFPDNCTLQSTQITTLKNGPYFVAAPSQLYNGNATLLLALGRGPDGHQLTYKAYQGSWSGQMPIGGNLVSGVSAASWARGRIDAFGVNSAGNVIHTVYAGGKWNGVWDNLGGVVNSNVSAVSWASGRLDIFARGASNNALYHKSYQSGVGWSAWENLGGVLTTGPTASTWGPGRLDVFAGGGGGALYHKVFNGKWNAWENLGGVITSDPSAVAWAPGRIDVFAKAGANNLYHKVYNGKWNAWENLGGVIVDAPSAVSRASGALDVFVHGLNGHLYIKSYAFGWGPFGDLGATETSNVSGVVWR